MLLRIATWGIVLVLGLVAILYGLVTFVPGFNARAYSALYGDNKPAPVVTLADGLHYVGASDIASYAIETGDGLILIDAGYYDTVPIILDNLATLGFAPSDVKILLNTHSHMDHAAGLARLKTATGARMLAGAIAKTELERGGRNDPLLGNLMAYDPVTVDQVVEDGGTVELGAAKLTMHHTPGHTPGCTSWQFKAVLNGIERNALLICSLSLLSYQIAGPEPSYPGIADAFRSTFAKLDALPCEIFLAPHASQFGLARKIAVRSTNPDALVDTPGCRAYVGLTRDAFEARYKEQSSHADQ